MKIGIKAIRQLLIGAEKIDINKFMKKGDYRDALNDFYRLKPRDVRNRGNKLYLQVSTMKLQCITKTRLFKHIKNFTIKN